MNIFNSYMRGDRFGIQQIKPSSRQLLGRREEVDIFAGDPFKIKSYNFRYAEKPFGIYETKPTPKLENIRQQFVNNNRYWDNKLNTSYDYSNVQCNKNNSELSKCKNLGSSANSRVPKSKFSKESCNKFIQQSQKKSPTPPTKAQKLYGSGISLPKSKTLTNHKSYTILQPEKLSSAKLFSKSTINPSKNSIGSRYSSIPKTIHNSASIKIASMTSDRTINSSTQTSSCNIIFSVKNSPREYINLSPSKRNSNALKSNRSPFQEISPYLSNNRNINAKRTIDNNKKKTNLLANWNSEPTEMIYRNPKNIFPSKLDARDLCAQLTLSKNNIKNDKFPIKSKYAPTVRRNNNNQLNSNKENSSFFNFQMLIEVGK